MCNRMRIGAVVIHPPNFLVSIAAMHKENLALCDSWNPAAQPENNFIGKFMRGYAGFLLSCRILILLAENLRRGDVLNVIEPALYRHVAAGHAHIAESEHGGVNGSRPPRREVHICRCADRAKWIKTLGSHVENAGAIQIIPQRVVENLNQGGALGVRTASFKVGNGQSDFLDAKTSAGTNPVLRMDERNKDQQQYKE